MPYQPHDPSANATYHAIAPGEIAHVAIFPSIGIARVGDSGSVDGVREKGADVQYYYAPEVPGGTDPPEGGFREKDGAHGIKRQVGDKFPLIPIYLLDLMFDF